MVKVQSQLMRQNRRERFLNEQGMRQPLRSQSFKYGPRTRVDGGRSSASGEHRTDERRRSTPNVSRKFSITPSQQSSYVLCFASHISPHLFIDL
ncbi:hypothetical protein AB6A40_007095 [Gnathostoma spinigerum]|uniref:Uncharacterized protein n=1 Tax=Gnathostoma spinigerum TaxID=75299 RepID=A0ABD6EM82_9BILA